MADFWRASTAARPTQVLGMSLENAKGWCDRQWHDAHAVDLQLSSATQNIWHYRRYGKWFDGQQPDVEQQIEAAAEEYARCGR